MQCINIDGTPLGGKDGSMVVYRTNEMGAAVGKWIGYTSTESVDFTIHYGFSSSHSESESTT